MWAVVTLSLLEGVDAVGWEAMVDESKLDLVLAIGAGTQGTGRVNGKRVED